MLNTRVRRGCGYRKAGYTYAVSSSSSGIATDDGFIDLDSHLLCLPFKMWDKSPFEIGLKTQGVAILPRIVDGMDTGIWDIFDWVGEDSYPFFPFFFEEWRRFGTSRLIPKTADFSKISLESRHWFLHSKAYFSDPLPFLEDRKMLKACPSGSELHDKPDLANGVYDFCTGLLWESIGTLSKKDAPRLGIVEFPFGKGVEPEFSFRAARAPWGIKPKWEVAILAWTAIEAFEIPVDNENDTHVDALLRLSEVNIDVPYYLVEE